MNIRILETRWFLDVPLGLNTRTWEFYADVVLRGPYLWNHPHGPQGASCAEVLILLLVVAPEEAWAKRSGSGAQANNIEA